MEKTHVKGDQMKLYENIYDLHNVLKEEIKKSKAKQGRDVFAIPTILAIEDEIKQATKLLNEFKNSSIYPDRISKALKYYEDIAKEWDKKVADKGGKAFCDRSEKQWYKDCKADLKRLQKEAKRLKL